jgi:hypothetical protein
MGGIIAEKWEYNFVCMGATSWEGRMPHPPFAMRSDAPHRVRFRNSAGGGVQSLALFARPVCMRAAQLTVRLCKGLRTAAGIGARTRLPD